MQEVTNNNIQLYDDKYLEFISEPKDKQMLSEIGQFMDKYRSKTTEIQIKSFVLNDVEYPTEYGKWQQAKVELNARYQNIVETYFELKELDVKIRREEARMKSTDLDEFDKELAGIEAEKLKLRYKSQLNRLKTIVDEARIYYEVFNMYPEFHDMDEETEKQYEAAQWGRKALNMPFIFQERYGENVLKQMWGEELFNKYEKFLEENKMILPRDAVLKTLGINNMTATLNPMENIKPKELADKEELKQKDNLKLNKNIINDPYLLGKA